LALLWKQLYLYDLIESHQKTIFFITTATATKTQIKKGSRKAKIEKFSENQRSTQR